MSLVVRGSGDYDEGDAGGMEVSYLAKEEGDTSADFGNAFNQARTTSNYFNQQNQAEDFTSVNQLHNAFATAMVNMPTRLQLFEVMDEWMIYIERALSIDRHLDPTIPDEVYIRLQEILKKEYETWDLIKALYFERLNEKPEEEQTGPFEEPINDKFHLDDMTFASAILQGNKSLLEMDLIIRWLELNYSRKGDPDLTAKTIAWENTLENLKRDVLLGRKGGSIVQHIDPDAPTRENKHLHPLDADEELKIQRGAYHYLRTGSMDKAVGFLYQSGQIAKAKSILGSLMSQKEVLSQIEEDEIVTLSAPRNTLSSNSEPVIQRRQKTNFNVIGNPCRQLWKNVAWSICEEEGLSKYERAVLGVCCGHRKSMLDVSVTWEDRLWAHLKVAVNVKIETELRNLNKVDKKVELPTEFWSQGQDIHQILDTLENKKRQDMGIDRMFQLLQKCVMTDNVGLFLDQVHANIDSIVGDAGHPVILDHLIRFVTHVILAFAVADMPYSEPLTNLICDAYINILVKHGFFSGTPFYAQKLSNELQVSVIVSQIKPERNYSFEEIHDFLQASAYNDLDILAIAVAVVDKLRDEVTEFEVDMLQWIGCCYDLVQNQSAVMLEYLRYTIWISRKYLTLGDLERVKKLIKKVSSECISAVEKINPAMVREFVCYREYLEAEDSLVRWKQAKSQRPVLEQIFEHLSNSVSERAVYDKKKKEFEIEENIWKNAVQHHGKVAIDAFMKILKFPDGGWLRNCVNPSEKDEEIHINAVRRIIIKKITFLILNLVKERRSTETFREFVYVLCESRRGILEEFSPTEIGSIFSVVESFIKSEVILVTIEKNSPKYAFVRALKTLPLRCSRQFLT